MSLSKFQSLYFLDERLLTTSQASVASEVTGLGATTTSTIASTSVSSVTSYLQTSTSLHTPYESITTTSASGASTAFDLALTSVPSVGADQGMIVTCFSF